MKRKTLILIILVLICTPLVLADSVQTPGVPTLPTPSPEQTYTATSTISGFSGSTVLSVSLANVDPNPAMAGNIVDVYIGIENMGGTTINNLMMEIMPEYPFEVAPGESAVKDVGIIEGYKVDSTTNLKIIVYKLRINKDTLAGSYEFKVKYYEQGSSDVTMKTLYIDVKSSSNIEVIHIDKTTLVPGRQSSLNFRINNVGNAPLRDVIFNWENKENIILPVGSDNTKYLKYIDVNDGFDLDYQVFADTNAKQGLYKLDLYLTYTDNKNGTRKQLSTMAGVYVGGGTDFDISFSENTNSEASFSVANTGSNPAYAILVIIPKQRSWKVSGSNTVMIGNLNSGDYTSASFKISSTNPITSQNATSNDPAPNSSSDNILMQISYSDTTGQRKVIEKEVELAFQDIKLTETTTGQGQNGSNYVAYIIIIAMIIFLASTYRKYKKQKLLDPDFKIWGVFLRSKRKKSG